MCDQRGRLVVIDDDVATCAMLRTHMESTDWQVTYFTSESDGLKYLSSHSPDVLLVDIRMPLINGDEILEELTAGNKLSSRTRVLVSSSVRPPRSIWRNFEKFGATFVPKDILFEKSAFLTLINGSG